MNSKNILFIAPIPPPINGQSKASIILLNSLNVYYKVLLVNLSKDSLSSGKITRNRLFQIIIILAKVYKNRNNNNIIYLSVAESFLGNLRDLFIYIICTKSKKKIFIHLLGGSGLKILLQKKSLLSFLNKYFLKQIAGIIVESENNAKIFNNFLPLNKVHIIPNFSEDYLFANNEEIISKFHNINKIQILFLSNLIYGKGYNELIVAYLSMPPDLQDHFVIKFVGGFENESEEKIFLKKIKLNKSLFYLGKFIDGLEKRNLYMKSHIFCLPTYYPYEGQPISILEAYATGCYVITTNHGGISNIFENKINGYLVEKKSISSLIESFSYIINNKNKLLSTSIINNKIALNNYRTNIYENKINQLFNNHLSNT